MGILSEKSISQVYGIRFLLHHHVGINLRGVDAGMPKKFARRVDVCPGCQRHGGKGVAARTLNLSYAFGPIRASLIDGAKLRQLHCGFRIFDQLFLKKSTRKQKQGDSFQRCQLSQENVNLFRNNVNNVRKVVN